MTDPEQKLTALKKAYADTILNTAKEAAARVMISEKKARGFQQELAAVRDEALRTCLRLKQMYDSKVKEAEMISLKKQQKIEELEAQLGEAEDIVGELRIELRESRYLLEKLTNDRQTKLSNEEKNPNEAVSLEVREDSSNHEIPVVANGIKPQKSDRDLSINRCSYKENKDPCLHTLPSILSRRREAEALEKNIANVDCADVESLTETRKEEEKENEIELSTTSVSPSEKISYKRKYKKDGKSNSSSPEGGGSSSQDDDDDESRNRRQKTGEKDNGYLDSFTSTEPSRDSRRVAQVARQLDESFFLRIEIGQSVIVDDPDGEFKVTAFDANHCPGAVMFLFEGSFGNILHTGDCRLTLDCLQSLPDKYVGKKHGIAPKCCLDYIFLDCTFGKSSHSQRFPSKHSAIRQIINCIWNHPDAPVVYLACYMLGQEDVLLEVSRTFGSKIYVDKASNLECFRSLMVIVPEIVSEDPSSRFHIFSGFPKLYERTSAKLAEARSKLQSEPLIIRPSAQWYVCDDEDYSQSGSQIQKQRKVRFSEAVKDEFGLWHVCYSMHSSREELELAMQLLSPKWVVSTVPSCRAMELNYVKKNCFISRFSPDDPFWKLLDIDIEVSSVASVDTHTVALGCCLMSEEIIMDSAKSKLEPVIESSSTKKKLLSLSPEKNLPVTLFGRARLSSQESDQLHERKVIHTQCIYTKTSPELEKLNLKKVVKSLQDDSKEETTEKESCRSFSSSSEEETCKDLSEDLIKLYRSMNAPVPRPLPSLMELMNARKRSRNHLSS